MPIVLIGTGWVTSQNLRVIFGLFSTHFGEYCNFQILLNTLIVFLCRDGLMKMKGVYEANPALGDPMSIEGQLNECAHQLDKLQQDLQKYHSYLEDMRSDTAAPHGSPSAPHRKNKPLLQHTNNLLNGVHSRNHRYVAFNVLDARWSARTTKFLWIFQVDVTKMA